MPELPEVDMMASLIKEGLGEDRNWSIQDVAVIRSNGKYLPDDELNKVRDSAIFDVRRRGKFLLFWTTEGMLVCHNAMSGYWDYEDKPWTFDYVEGKREATESDVRVKMTISPSGPYRPSDRVLRFHDSRLFGSLRFYETWSIDDIPSLKNLGPECLDTDHSFSLLPPLTRQHIFESSQKFKKTVKEFLMTQEIIAGLGNIYAAETLFSASIDPRRPAKSLTDNECRQLHRESYFILLSAVKNQCDYSSLKVYRRNICAACKGKILMEKIAGRSTYFCASCQK